MTSVTPNLDSPANKRQRQSGKQASLLAITLSGSSVLICTDMTVEVRMPNSGVEVSDEMSIFRLVENGEANYKRCLFGKPDKRSTELLLMQQFELDRKKCIANWGFDILTCQPIKQHRVKTPKKKSRRSENKENIDISRKGSLESNELDCCKSTWNKENQHPDFIIPKKSLKMISEKSYAKKGRQSTITDYWNYRKISESSSCSDKEN